MGCHSAGIRWSVGDLQRCHRAGERGEGAGELVVPAGGWFGFTGRIGEMQLKRIRQKDGTGCGIACVAMVVGESYSTVMKVARDIFYWEKDKRSFYTTASQLRDLLLAFGNQSQRGRSVRRWSSRDHWH